MLRVYYADLRRPDPAERQGSPAADPSGNGGDRYEESVRRSRENAARQHNAARRLLLFGLARDHGIRDPRIAVDEMGKPYLEGEGMPCFNLSHCREAAACAIGDLPVGIDVEQCFAWKDNLARRICSRKEMEIMPKEEARREELLGRIWSRKESWLKCIGTGIRRELDSFSVLPDSRPLQIQVREEEDGLVWTGFDAAPEDRVYHFLEARDSRLNFCVCSEDGELLSIERILAEVLFPEDTGISEISV